MSANEPGHSAGAVEGDAWPFSFVEHVRFGHLDAMRHLNNVEFLRFYETARIVYITTLVPSHRPDNPTGDWGLIFAECHINYRAPAYYETQIKTSIRPSHLRRSSVRLEFKMTDATDNRPLADGWGALVGYDYAKESAMPLPDTLVRALSDHGATQA